MKPLIICDVDCTLYSYREFIRTNFLHPEESMRALFSIPTKGDRFPAVERTWDYYESHIQERIRLLHEVTASFGELLFLSAFPAEDYKKNTFDKLSMKFMSSFPKRKINFLQSQLKPDSVALAIGDRPNDRGISLAYQSKLVYLPFYSSLHQKTGQSYTSQLIERVKEQLST